MDNPEALEFVIRALADFIPPDAGLDAAFLFGETEDNEDSVLSAGAKLLKDGTVRRIGICAHPAISGYPGPEKWAAELYELDISEKNIARVPGDPSLKIATTLTEAEDLIRYAKSEKWRSVCIVAQPIHQVRSFLTAISCTLGSYPELRIYSATGTPLSYDEEVVHSQGETRGRRGDLVQGEWERIGRYQEKRDLISFAAALRYLNARDAS